MTVRFTQAELAALRQCVAGELENDDGMNPFYFPALARAAKKLDAAAKTGREARSRSPKTLSGGDGPKGNEGSPSRPENYAPSQLQGDTKQ